MSTQDVSKNKSPITDLPSGDSSSSSIGHRSSPFDSSTSLSSRQPTFLQTPENHGLCPVSTQLSPLLTAIKISRLDDVRLLLESGADVHARDSDGRIALHWAAEIGDSPTAALLLHHGADINARNNNGSTPLHLSVKTGGEDVVSLLLEKGADLHARDQSGWSVLHYASFFSSSSVVSLLLDRGCNIEDRDNLKRTPLHMGAIRGYFIVNVLLDRGADIHVKDKFGQTALHLAVQFRRERVVPILFGRGVDVNAKDIVMCSPLHWTAKKPDIKTLLGYISDFQTRDFSWWTELSLCSQKENNHITRLLLENGADVNEKDANGYTALHCAAESVFMNIFRLLVRKGADVDVIEYHEGKTALHILAQKDGCQVLNLAVTGIHTKVKDVHGKTCYQYLTDRDYHRFYL